MADMKKYNGTAWVDTTLRQYKTVADTFTTLPAVIYPTGTTATVGLKGNTSQQSGTTTPENPIMPEGCGERTGNLADLYNVDKTQVGLRVTTGNNMKVVVNGTKGSENNVIVIKEPNIIVPAGTYTVKIKMTSGSITDLTSDGVFFGINASTYSQRTAPAVTKIGEVGRRTFTLSEDTTISSFDITPSYGSAGAKFDNATFECWFYVGSDDKPYEPYGYKIPISSAGQTTPVYLGDVQTTRKIKKLVLTGKETWYMYSSGVVHQLYTSGKVIDGVALSSAYSTIAPYGMTANNRNGDYGCYPVSSGSEIAFQMYGSRADFPTQTEWKSYLAQQYTTGTPVTVWYVLATEETAVVNEPLMKIGDYADAVSNVSIPVIAGGDTLSVDTTVQPSEVSLSYTGWHDASVKEWDGSQWNE